MAESFLDGPVPMPLDYTGGSGGHVKRIIDSHDSWGSPTADSTANCMDFATIEANDVNDDSGSDMEPEY